MKGKKKLYSKWLRAKNHYELKMYRQKTGREVKDGLHKKRRKSEKPHAGILISRGDESQNLGKY